MMPDPLAHELRGKRLKADAHGDPAVPLENAKAGVEKFADGKIRRPPKARAGATRLTDARQREGPQLLAIEIKPEEIPLVIDTAEMVRAHPARLGRGAA